MSRQRLMLSGLAVLVAFIVACGQSSAPTSPSAGSATVASITGPDGSTLKASAPALVSPASGARITQGTPVVLVLTNSTTNVPLSLVYRFEIKDANGSVIDSTTVSQGVTTTSKTVTASLSADQTYSWRGRAELGNDAGAWSATRTFIAPANDGYNRAGELYDPLINGRTVGTIHGNATFIPGQGIRLNDAFAYVVYDMSQVVLSGEMSAEVSNLGPGGPCCKVRVFSMIDRLGIPASSSQYSMNAQYRGVGGNPDNCICFKAIFGDNARGLEPSTTQRLSMGRVLDPSKVYLWRAIWTRQSYRLRVTELATGALIYDFTSDPDPLIAWNPSKMYAFLGSEQGAFDPLDGTLRGVTIKNFWVGSTPRP
jgi:hypothetical protein